MTNRKIKTEGRSLKQALNLAAKELGVTQDKLEFKLESEPKPGFLPFLIGKKIEISAWVKCDANTKASRHSNGEGNGEAIVPRLLSPSEMKDLQEDLTSFCQGICEFICDEKVKVKTTLDNERLILDVDNEMIAKELARNSKMAEAFEHILRKKPRYLQQELPFRIFFDAKSYRLHREDELVQMAKDLSDQVHENRKPIVLNYKSSYDRKIIHVALDKDDRVYTKSIGTGAGRKLMILPKKTGQNSELRDLGEQNYNY